MYKKLRFVLSMELLSRSQIIHMVVLRTSMLRVFISQVCFSDVMTGELKAVEKLI